MGTNGAGLSVLWTAIGNSDRPSHPTETVPTVVLLREVLQFATGDARLPVERGGWRFKIGQQHEEIRIIPSADNGLRRPALQRRLYWRCLV